LWDFLNSTSTCGSTLLPSIQQRGEHKDHQYSQPCPLSTAQLRLSGRLTSSNVSSDSVDIPMNNIVITLLARPTHDDPAKSSWLHNIPHPAALLLCSLFGETVTRSPLWNAGVRTPLTTSDVPTNVMVRLIIDTNNYTEANALVRYNGRVLNYE
jgi:hypothetical protein